MYRWLDELPRWVVATRMGCPNRYDQAYLFHRASLEPLWNVKLIDAVQIAITGLRSFWMQSGEALSAIAALDYSKEERKRLATLYVIACVCFDKLRTTRGLGLGIGDAQCARGQIMS